MNVAALQRHLREVAALAGAAGGSLKVVNDIQACAEALSPFAHRPVAELTAYLARVAEVPSDGPVKWPAGATPPRKNAEPKSAPEPTDKGRATVEKLHRFYESIATTHLSDDEIRAELNAVDKLIKNDLEALGGRVNALADVRKAKTVSDKKIVVRKAIIERLHRYGRNFI